ncbi:MarR family transcriptional regulator [Lactobacillus sp. IBH004]|uniref:MarR family winged helix-turn-helix transcriptional regulator n=1 Tax=Lactobacillus sp. IBH004 TaxID=2879107 RepID=UPI002243728A|nr:MarR family transcriptional regulator [Lactobacillus sp. IBH004]UZN41430.1 MarR family transcriptional regulator [Lactobacillus sp. IBH004]
MDVLSFSTIAGNIKNEINRKCGLNLSQTRILLYFDQNNNTALKMGDLADNLKISLSTLSRQLQQKKTVSFITVKRSEKDSSKIVLLNETGLQKIIQLKQVLNEIEEALLQGLSKQEVATFNRIFSELLQRSEK